MACLRSPRRAPPGSSGRYLGVCTSKRADFAEKILDRCEIRDFFTFVDGGDIGVTKRSQLEHLRAEGSVDAGSMMIGDRSVDIEAAHANGLDSAGVLWGYGSEAELETAGAGRLLRRVDELPDLAAGSDSGSRIAKRHGERVRRE